ncbi:berberine bridge enzyme-like 21 [Euphorbia lathyris]|uniref:berberine bridge enzyme-like 21 n=1 Tax=Euphorbia lathyris TaxID=212925 RepID=UPI003313E7B7
MAKPKHLPCIFLILINIYLSSSFIARVSAAAAATDDNAVYTSLIQCLEKNTTPQDKIADIVFSKTNSNYTSVLRAYIRNARMNTTETPKPVVIITPKQIKHVQAAVICTKQVGFLLKIRSGGHDYEGISYTSAKPFFVLDMNNLRSVEVDVPAQSAWVQVGATLGEVYHGIWEKSKVHGYPAGVCPTVGVGGHISGGGYGAMIRKYGLAVDNLIDAQIVDVNGKLMNRKEMGEDLFWAISGGGGASFGVVIAYQIKLVPVPPTVTFFRVEKTIEENATDLVVQWQTIAPKMDPNLFMRMLVQPSKPKDKLTIKITIMSLYLGTPDTLMPLVAKDFPGLGLKKEDCLTGSWIQAALWWANYDNYTTTSPDVLLDRKPDKAHFQKRKSDYVQVPINKQGLETIWKTMLELGEVGLVFNAYGGKMDEIDPTATPYPHRKGNLYKIQYSVNWDEPGKEETEKCLEQARKLHKVMTPYVSKNPRGAFWNYRDLDLGINSWGPNSFQEASAYGHMYFGQNFQRLVKIKTAVDPDNFFKTEQSIPPSK